MSPSAPCGVRGVCEHAIYSHDCFFGPVPAFYGAASGLTGNLRVCDECLVCYFTPAPRQEVIVAGVFSSLGWVYVA